MNNIDDIIQLDQNTSNFGMESSSNQKLQYITTGGQQLESSYYKSPKKNASKAEYLEYSTMRRTQGNYNASAKKSIGGDRNMSNPPKNSSAFQELDDYSEMNQSIKMSYNQPKYHEGNVGKAPSMVMS